MLVFIMYCNVVIRKEKIPFLLEYENCKYMFFLKLVKVDALPAETVSHSKLKGQNFLCRNGQTPWY